MSNFSQPSKDINSIKYFRKEKNTLFYEKDEQWISFDINEDELLSEFKQFVKITSFIIVNLNHINDYVLNSVDGFFIIDGKFFNIARRFIPKTRASHKEYLIQKYPYKTKTSKATWNCKKKESESDFIIKNNTHNIKYLIRKGLVTTIYYNNSDSKRFYETLRYFEDNFEKSTQLVRINRNCIINVHLVKSCIINGQKKTGKVIIDTESFDVSRRLFPEFKRKIKAINAVFKLRRDGRQDEINHPM